MSKTCQKLFNMSRRQKHHMLHQIFCAVGHWLSGTQRLDRGCGAPRALLAAFSPLRLALVTTTCSFVVSRLQLGDDDGRFAITSFTRPPPRATHSSPRQASHAPPPHTAVPPLPLRRSPPRTLPCSLSPTRTGLAWLSSSCSLTRAPAPGRLSRTSDHSTSSTHDS